MENVVNAALGVVTIRVALIAVADGMVAVIADAFGREANGKC